MSDVEWGIRYPDGTTMFGSDEDEAAAIVNRYPAHLALVRRSADRVPWICALCDGYGVLDGLEPCPGNALGVCGKGVSG